MEFHDRGSLCQLLDAIEDEPRLYLRIERGARSSDNIVIIRWANAPGSPIKVIAVQNVSSTEKGLPSKLNVTSSRLGATI